MHNCTSLLSSRPHADQGQKWDQGQNTMLQELDFQLTVPVVKYVHNHTDESLLAKLCKTELRLGPPQMTARPMIIAVTINAMMDMVQMHCFSLHANKDLPLHSA